MLFKSNYIKKGFSAILLAMLLFIHSIKLLHTHSGNKFFSDHGCSTIGEKNDDPEVVKSFADCSICSYQLSKDAGDLLSPFPVNYLPLQNICNTRLIPFHKFSFPSAFENRGPPSVI